MYNNKGVLMPENIIYKSLESMFKVIKLNWASKTNKDDTLLSAFFKKDVNDNDIVFNSLNYYEQAIKLFIEKNIQINMGYNMEVANIPSVHILLPNESGKPFGIGADEGYVDNNYETEGDNEFVTPVFTSSFDSTYQIMVTSTNIFEVLLIYNLMKIGILSLYEHLEFSGLRNIKIGGQDVNFQSDLLPTHIFHRTLSLSFFYEMSAPSFFREQVIKEFTATGIIN